jgi:putative inorganic carbon (hco3(-)) transporter
MSPVLLLLVGYVVLVPLVLVPTAWNPHDAARLAQLGTLALAALCLLIPKYRATGAVPRWARYGLPVFAMLAAASVFGAAMPEMALREALLLTALVVLTIASAREVALRGTAALQAALVTSCALYAATLVILFMVAMITGTGLDPTDLAAGYLNYRFFNHIQTVTIPLLAFITLRRETPASVRGAAWFALVVNAAFVFGLGARGTAAGIVIAAIASALLADRQVQLKLVLRLAAGGLAGLALYGLFFWWLPAAFDAPLAQPLHRSMASLSSDSARMGLWRLAWDDILRAPWLGIGPMHYAHEPNPKAAHPHNAFLQIAAEWGVPMLLLVCAVLTYGVHRLIRAVRCCADEQKKIEGVALLTACLAVIFDASVSGNIVMPVPQMWIAFCAAWAIGWACTLERTDGPVGSRPAPFTTPVALAFLASQIWLLVSVWPEASDLPAHFEHVHRDIVHNAKMNPRFWSDGWF